MQIARDRKAVLLILLGIGALGCILIVTALKSFRQPTARLETPTPTQRDIPGTFYLRTSSVPDGLRAHLLDGDFRTVSKVNEISGDCIQVFESSFITISGSRAKPGEVSLANPGEAFQASDAILPGLPFRRLQFAGLGPSKCFIHYQSGGQPSAFCTAVIDYENQRIVWVGEYHEAGKNLDDLRRMLALGQVRNTSGRAC